MGLLKIMEDRRIKRFRTKHKIGLCFSGGGTKGFAYIGVLKAFEEAGIKFDAVAGTSVGSIFASMYAGGATVSDMQKLSKDIKNSDLRDGKLKFMPSSTDRLEELLRSSLPIEKIEDAKIELYIPAVDLKTGREICFTHGDLAKIICGSCAVSPVFQPVDYEGYTLIDGGYRDNIPAEILRKNGCDFVVTVDCNTTREKGTTSTNPIRIALTCLEIAQVNNSKRGLELSDIVITPDLSKFSAFDVKGKEEMIEIGYRATKSMLFRIKDLFNGKVRVDESKQIKTIDN